MLNIIVSIILKIPRDFKGGIKFIQQREGNSGWQQEFYAESISDAWIKNNKKLCQYKNVFNYLTKAKFSFSLSSKCKIGCYTTPDIF